MLLKQENISPDLTEENLAAADTPSISVDEVDVRVQIGPGRRTGLPGCQGVLRQKLVLSLSLAKKNFNLKVQFLPLIFSCLKNPEYLRPFLN